MIVYQTDWQGYLVEVIEARANPRPDPEIPNDDWLIPAGCVTAAPPSVGAGQIPRYVDGAWTVETIPVPPEPEEPTPEEQLQAWRQTANLSDIQFAIALSLPLPPFITEPILTTTEAEAWVARGEIPALGLAALAMIENPIERQIARIRFAGARVINRLDPFILLLQAYLDLPDEVLDALFQFGATL